MVCALYVVPTGKHADLMTAAKSIDRLAIKSAETFAYPLSLSADAKNSNLAFEHFQVCKALLMCIFPSREFYLRDAGEKASIRTSYATRRVVK